MVFNNNFIAVVRVNGKVLRESKEGVVRIPFGSEYSILLKNKSNQRAIVNVEINGDNALSDNQIVVGANSKLNLEGFIDGVGDVSNKFKFIEKTAQISEHRGDDPEDGIIRITYQFEWLKPQQRSWYNSKVYKSPDPFWNDGNQVYYGSSQSIGETKLGAGPFASSLNCDSAPQVNCCLSKSSNFNGAPFVGTIETDHSLSDDGLTVPGSASDQEFKTAKIGILEDQEHVICLQLKGGNPITGRKVKQAVYVTTKLACGSCGMVSNAKFDFCPVCGTALKSFA